MKLLCLFCRTLVHSQCLFVHSWREGTDIVAFTEFVPSSVCSIRVKEIRIGSCCKCLFLTFFVNLIQNVSNCKLLVKGLWLRSHINKQINWIEPVELAGTPKVSQKSWLPSELVTLVVRHNNLSVLLCHNSVPELLGCVNNWLNDRYPVIVERRAFGARDW